MSSLSLSTLAFQTSAVHTSTHASYRDGIFDFFGITIGKRPHEVHDQPLKLPCQLILQVRDEVLGMEEHHGRDE